jgi:hypothetical protein
VAIGLAQSPDMKRVVWQVRAMDCHAADPVVSRGSV